MHQRNNRRWFLKGVTLGAGSLVFSPLLQKIAAAAEGKVTTPKRVIFFVFDNGFKDDGAVPVGTNLVSDKTRQFSLEGHKLPLDIEPFTPFLDRITLLHGMRSHAAVDHGGFFAALSGSVGNKHTPQAESIDAAIARVVPSVFPLLHLGIGGGHDGLLLFRLGQESADRRVVPARAGVRDAVRQYRRDAERLRGPEEPAGLRDRRCPPAQVGGGRARARAGGLPPRGHGIAFQARRAVGGQVRYGNPEEVRPEHMPQVFVRHVFRYYLGRNETLADGPTLVAAHKAYRESKGSFKALLVSLLSSDSFLYRSIPARSQETK